MLDPRFVALLLVLFLLESGLLSLRPWSDFGRNGALLIKINSWSESSLLSIELSSFFNPARLLGGGSFRPVCFDGGFISERD